MELKFFNTLGRELQEFKPINDKEVCFYACGPTVYNYAHIGNFRAYMFEDLLHRTLKYFGYNVKMVMNLTDVDDKTIRDSKAAGIPLREFTKKYKDAFFSDLETLRIEKATVYPAATECIGDMIKIIKKLEEKGYAYKASDGSVYYSITKFKEYGKLAKIDMENQLSGVRIKNDEYAKDSVADFALWKAWDEDDGDVFWGSPWGKGRPGWHIECSAMSQKHLGPHFDIHTGGIDNMFPHHEDEIAQSEAANGCKYVNYWLHCAHLMVDGDKMSKSKGNFYKLIDLLERGYEGRFIRWVLLTTHYRKQLNFTFDACESAKTHLIRFRELFKKLHNLNEDEGDDVNEVIENARNGFRAGLADDLNISESLAVVHKLYTTINKMLDSGTLSKSGANGFLELFREFDEVFAVFDVDDIDVDIPDNIIAIAEDRKTARANKEGAKSDELRDQLKSLGWQIEDIPNGYNLVQL
jgi:cysteinyl-tRNA synthetase